MSDDVNHPTYYTSHPSGVECIEITRHMTFNLGNAVKYIWRAGLKSPDRLQDLKKAEFYIKDEIARLEEAGTKKVLAVMGSCENIAYGGPHPRNYGNGELPLVPRFDAEESEQ